MTTIIVTFNIASQEFTYHDYQEWYSLVDRWREELKRDDEDEEYIDLLDTEEVVDMYHGDELFYTEIDV